MASQEERYIVYITFGEKEFPVECKSMCNDDFREEMIKLTDVKGLSDNAFPDIQINDLCIPKSMIQYYFIGKLKSDNLENKDENKHAVSEANDSQSDIFTR